MSKKQYSKSDVKTGYYGYSSESKRISGNNKSKKSTSSKMKKSAAIGIVLAFIQLLASAAFVGLALYKNFAFITTPVLIGTITVLVLLFALVLFTQKGSLTVKRVGKVISVIVIILLLLLIYLIAPLDRMSGKKVSKDPFIVFVSANDTFGSFDADAIGRSDTNILAVVNPKTYTVLMISTPRDYYVPIQAKGVAENSFDKLTHLGLYGNGIPHDGNGHDLTASDWQWAQEVKWHPGCDTLMDTLKYIYKFDLPEDRYHYVKLNFTGFAKLIDSLGGITVDVDVPFSTTTYASYGDVDDGARKTYTYTKGKMKMDGDTALTFARERHSFAAGDMQRNQNQVKVLKAMSNKLLSGTTLLHYTSIVDSIQDSFTTDMDISSMVSLQTQISMSGDYDGWNIMSFGVVGPTDRQICTYNGRSLSVVMQNEASISRATNLINMVLDGNDATTVKKQIKAYNKEQ